MNLTALETVRAVARHAAESPSPPDRSAESSARAAESSARVAESSVRAADTPDEPRRGFWRRIARVLWRLLAARAVDVRFARVATRAPVAFQPLFEIDGLPADPRAMPGLSTRAAARIDLLRQERASRAFVRPDRPPAAGPSATASSDRAIGFWDDLLDGISEALEIFIAIGDAVGAERLVEILELLMRIFPDQQPEAA